MPRHGLSHGSSAPGPIARGLAGRRLQQPAYGPAGRATPAGSAVPARWATLLPLGQPSCPTHLSGTRWSKIVLSGYNFIN